MGVSRSEYDALLYLLQTDSVDWNDISIRRLSQSKGFGRNGYLEDFGTRRKTVYNRRIKLRSKARQHNMYVEEGKLMANTIDRATKVPIPVTVVADEDAPGIILEEHETRGHIGINALFNIMSKKYLGIKKKRVINCVGKCKHCLIEKPANYKAIHNTPIKIYVPFERVGIDFTLYQPPYPRECVNIMTCIDYFSRFGWAFIMQDTTAESTAKNLRSLFLRLGRIPKEIQCDNGAQFSSDIVRCLMELLKVQMKFALPYTPTTGGRFERFHPNLKHKLDAVFSLNMSLKIEQALDSALYMYNTAPHSALSYKGKPLTPLEVWQPGVVDWARIPNQGPGKFRLEKVTTPPPSFDEDIWEQVVNVVHESGQSATEAVMRAETRIMYPQKKQDSDDDDFLLDSKLLKGGPRFTKRKDFSHWLPEGQKREDIESQELQGVKYSDRDMFREIRRSVLSKDKHNVTWNDIIGQDEAKHAMKRSLVWPSQRPDLFEDIEAYKGILLYGPPGTGKTLLAKAVANEINSTFLFVTASNLLSKWIGESVTNMSLIYHLARCRAPSIIFIDEIDAICASRDKERQSNHDNQLLTQLLQELEGFAKTEKVILIGATNCPWNIDSAMIRRFGRRIYMPLPLVQDMAELITRICAADMDFDLNSIIPLLHGYSSSDIANICSEAKLLAAQQAIEENLSQRPKVSVRLFKEALSKMTRSVPRTLIERYEKWNEPDL